MLSLLLVTAARRHLPSRGSRVMASMADEAVERRRLEEQMERVDLAAPPRVELTYTPPGGLDLLAESVGVLDASFNPPTRAHMYLLDVAAQRFGMKSTLLLLAKQNADKPVVGASLVQRLQMMRLLAQADASGVRHAGVTAHPLFVDKAVAMRRLCGERARVYLLVGYDTWVRIIDPKYYPAGGLDAALGTIFATVDVVVASRDASGAASLASGPTEGQQEELVAALPHSVTGGRLHFLRNDAAMAPLSSSAVRRAVAAGDLGAAREMVPDSLHAYVERRGLYVD